MQIVKNIRKTKYGMYFALVGILLSIFLTSLVVIYHVNTLKLKNIFSDFSINSSYEITYHTTKQNIKRKLFDYQNYHFYGYGIDDIKIQYQGLEMNLRTILKEEYFTFEEFLSNFSFVYETEDKAIKKYENRNLMVVETIYENNIDVVINAKG